MLSGIYVGGKVGTLSRCHLAPCYFYYQVTLAGGDITENAAPSVSKGLVFDCRPDTDSQIQSAGYRQRRTQ